MDAAAGAGGVCGRADPRRGAVQADWLAVCPRLSRASRGIKKKGNAGILVTSSKVATDRMVMHFDVGG